MAKILLNNSIFEVTESVLSNGIVLGKISKTRNGFVYQPKGSTVKFKSEPYKSLKVLKSVLERG